MPVTLPPYPVRTAAPCSCSAKELAGSPGADSYETALRVLFDLDPDAVQAVVRADAGLVPWPGEEAGQ